MTAKALAAMGWRVDTAARLNQAIKDFQTGWNLGPALAIDGNAGPATRNALQVSMARRAVGLPDFSDHFNATEFACTCGGTNPGCRRIWIIRSAVRLAEALRPVIGPFTPRTGCRCTVENARVGGAKSSQHLYGAALDLGTNATVYDLPVAAVRRLGVASGIGFYDAGGGRTAVRHVDVRHVSGNNTTRSTTANPSQWIYGTLGSRRVVPLNPDAAKPAPPVVTPPGRPKEDYMAAISPEDWRHMTTGPAYAFYKNVLADDPETAPRIPLGLAIENATTAALAVKAAIENTPPEGE